MKTTFENGDTYEKNKWRAGVMEMFDHYFPKGIPKGEFIVTMSADYSIVENGKRIIDPKSLVSRLLKKGIPASSIITIDWDKEGKNVTKNNDLASQNSTGGKIRNLQGEFFAMMEMLIEQEKKRIAFIDEDMMCTPLHKGFSRNQGNLMVSLSKSNNDTLLALNLCVRPIMSPELEETCHKYLMMGDAGREFRNAIYNGKFRPAMWALLDEPVHHPIQNRYISGGLTMETNYYTKTKNKNFTPALQKRLAKAAEKKALAEQRRQEREEKKKKKVDPYYDSLSRGKKAALTRKRNNRMNKAKQSTTFKDKSPKMVNAGHKAYQTRLANLAKAAK
jgi:hypothetical protein